MGVLRDARGEEALAAAAELIPILGELAEDKALAEGLKNGMKAGEAVSRLLTEHASAVLRQRRTAGMAPLPLRRAGRSALDFISGPGRAGSLDGMGAGAVIPGLSDGRGDADLRKHGKDRRRTASAAQMGRRGVLTKIRKAGGRLGGGGGSRRAEGVCRDPDPRMTEKEGRRTTG